MKNGLKRLASRSGLYVASTDRFGIDLELDLARLTAKAPLQTIFDVGANFGQTAVRFARSFPSATIFCFEPVPASFAKLQRAVRPLRQVRPVNAALGDTVGTVRINIAPNAGSNSIRAVGSAVATLDASVDTVDRVCDRNGIDVVDLLKIDVEGFELPVLRGADRRLSGGQVRYVYAECVFSPNDEMPHTGFADLHELLVKRGFCFVTYYAESFNLRLGCALGNVLYAHRDSLPSDVPGRVRSIA